MDLRDSRIPFTDRQWNTPVAELELYGLPLEILNALDEHGYYHVHDLQRLTEEMFLKFSGMSNKRFRVFQNVLVHWYVTTRSQTK